MLYDFVKYVSFTKAEFAYCLKSVVFAAVFHRKVIRCPCKEVSCIKICLLICWIIDQSFFGNCAPQMSEESSEFTKYQLVIALHIFEY